MPCIRYCVMENVEYRYVDKYHPMAYTSMQMVMFDLSGKSKPEPFGTKIIYIVRDE